MKIRVLGVIGFFVPIDTVGPSGVGRSGDHEAEVGSSIVGDGRNLAPIPEKASPMTFANPRRRGSRQADSSGIPCNAPALADRNRDRLPLWVR